MIRRPVVAGSFYPGNERILRQELEQLIEESENKRKVIGLISPHAGYVYSGSCAGKGFGRVHIPGIVIILGPNHQGYGHPYAVDGHQYWATPLGNIEIETNLREQLVEKSEIFKTDTLAGSREHSLEVQVPFIQYFNPNAKILPITISSVDVESLVQGGRELAQLIQNRDDVLIVASSDMSHYVSAETAKAKDFKAIQHILDLQPVEMFQTVARDRISMCGVSPTTMMLSAALELGAKNAEIIEYTNSGKASGDFSQVVAYLSLIVY